MPMVNAPSPKMTRVPAIRIQGAWPSLLTAP
jgi:hypothetical protein